MHYYMNAANLELCRELFELSRWGKAETHLTYYDGDLGETEPWDRDADNRKSIPAYDLGYLLRKLPQSVKGDTYRLGLVDNVKGYRAGYYNERFWETYEQYADTPEDAVVKVAILLFNLDILKSEQ